MKNWWKVLALGCACVFATTLLVACDSKLNASASDDDSAVGNTNTTTPAPDDNHVEAPTESTDPTKPEEPKEEPPHVHHYGDWQIVTTPTCATDGLERRTCDGCDDSEEQILNATGEHDYALTDSTPATCTVSGSATHTCQTCNDSYTVDLPATGHQYSDTIYEPTCSEDGYIVRRCACGDTSTETLPDTATGRHDFVTRGHTHTCATCGTVEYDLPIENLDGSYWYLDGWAIYFDTFEDFDGFFATGTFHAYYGELDENGNFTNSGTPYLIDGNYEFLKISDTEYTITLLNNNTASLGIGVPHEFFLEYVITTDANGNSVYQLQGDFSKLGGNTNSTLTFVGYDLQYNDEH